VLCEAAQTAKRRPDYAAGYQDIARRPGKKIATTAIARKLLTRAYHLLTDASSAGAPASREGRQPRVSSRFRMSRPRRAR
jgi:transposase